HRIMRALPLVSMRVAGPDRKFTSRMDFLLFEAMPRSHAGVALIRSANRAPTGARWGLPGRRRNDRVPLAWSVVAVILFSDVFVDLNQVALSDRDRDRQERVLTKVPPIILRRELGASRERRGSGAAGEAEKDGVDVGGGSFAQLRFVLVENFAFRDVSLVFLR